MNIENIENQIKSVMIGHAVADALGVPVEFCTRWELQADPVTDMRGFGTYSMPAGSWSDDTSMALATMDAMLLGEVNLFGTMVNCARWIGEGKYTPTGKCFDAGGICVSAIRRFTDECYSPEHGFVLPPNFDMTKCGQNGERANGNGSLMRIHPLVLYAYCKQMTIDQWEPMIFDGSAITHAHPRSLVGCGIYAFLLMRLLYSPHIREVKIALQQAGEHYHNHPEYASYARLFDADFDKLDIAEIKSTGYIVDTLEAAVWCLLTTNSYQECVLKAVNLGEDTDTVAAVAGGLAGALYGYESIPQAWKETLIQRQYIEDMCHSACKAWTGA